MSTAIWAPRRRKLESSVAEADDADAIHAHRVWAALQPAQLRFLNPNLPVNEAEAVSHVGDGKLPAAFKPSVSPGRIQQPFDMSRGTCVLSEAVEAGLWMKSSF